ncbi:hypothetical protein BCV69DRAFT_4340 [Microstroma glucosiphilum]|uniref:Uncharacterized protein n=1 Tax=Pseudomicrostroma glucosiphilum TaxID=1684307 RepID=A0A316UK41_9BASI|nr:hypothetical protein BCV69DRAFT_4340 [Pseudomicrostroma glucosiphilum]PWN23595.1 hypothetical protein BCV69DRAFT_4340 [Pseudomicrostroma glucosiphilum]
MAEPSACPSRPRHSHPPTPTRPKESKVALFLASAARARWLPASTARPQAPKAPRPLSQPVALLFASPTPWPPVKVLTLTSPLPFRLPATLESESQSDRSHLERSLMGPERMGPPRSRINQPSLNPALGESSGSQRHQLHYRHRPSWTMASSASRSPR